MENKKEEKIVEVTDNKNQTQSTILMDMCKGLELFHTPIGEPYATIPVGEHFETWLIKNQGFRNWLQQSYYKKYSSIPNKQSMQDTIDALSGKAVYDGEERKVFLRIGENKGNVYVDLCNRSWQVVEISPTGWKVINNSPIKFRRPKGMLSLPIPIESRSSTINDLRKYLNVETDDDFKLIVAWIINTINPFGPYLVLVLYGEQGSAKSTTVKTIRALVDPNEAPLRREPKNADDLMVSAMGNWIVAIDNMSHLPNWLSDDLCRLATEGALSKRTLYTDNEETILNAKRPIILNGIDEFVARGDLASRAIILNLPIISSDSRKREKTFWADFASLQPSLLGFIFSAISTALRLQNTFELEAKFRMADAWHWIAASESALGWPKGSMVNAFKMNQLKANEVVLNSSGISAHIKTIAEDNVPWTGTASDLLSKLNMMAGSSSYDKYWPSNPKALTDKIRRLNPAFRMVGIEIDFFQTNGRNSKKLIQISKNQSYIDVRDASTQDDPISVSNNLCVEQKKLNSNELLPIDFNEFEKEFTSFRDRKNELG